jgi:phage shock protein PspC (stress-responsive transcriptional regulator)
MKEAMAGLYVMTTVVGAVGLVLAGYIIIINSLPDLRRYIRISSM